MTNDPRKTWQLQPVEDYKLSLQHLRLKAQQLAIKIRFQFLGISVTLLGAILFDLWNFHVSPYPLQRAGFMLAAAWAFSAWIQAGQNIWPSSVAKDAEWLTCLAFSRNELQRRLSYSNYIWGGLAGPALFMLAVIVAPGVLQIFKTPEQFPKVLPVLILLVIWVVMFSVMRKRERQKLRLELDELNSLASESS